MLQLKKLIRPTRKSGKKLPHGKTSTWKKFGVVITNVSGRTIYVDSVTPRRKAEKASKR